MAMDMLIYLLELHGYAGAIRGRSYVVFGGSGIGGSGGHHALSLNGVNGFKLDGENSGDDSGRFGLVRAR